MRNSTGSSSQCAILNEFGTRSSTTRGRSSMIFRSPMSLGEELRQRRRLNVDMVRRSKEANEHMTVLLTYHVEVIPDEHWHVPDWVNLTRFDESAKCMERAKVKNAGMMSYHQMCRYYSGFFYKHPALTDFRYYWRVEPNVQYVSLLLTFYHFRQGLPPGLTVTKIKLVSSAISTTTSSATCPTTPKPTASP